MMKLIWVGRLQEKGKNLGGVSILGSCPDVGFCNMVTMQNRTMGTRMELFFGKKIARINTKILKN
jgi:hypothetical protein